MVYTDKQAAHDYIRDLVVDIRCARRDGLPEYAEACEYVLRRVWSSRQNVSSDPRIAYIVRGQQAGCPHGGECNC